MNARLLDWFALPLVERFSQSQFWSIYKNMARMQHSQPGERARAQENKLASLLQSAAEKTPYWREAFASLGIMSDTITPENARDVLRRLPVTTKAVYSSGFPDQVTAADGRDNWQYLSSAGTTGRMTVVVDFNKRDHLRAAEHLNLKMALGQPLGAPAIDIPPSACNVVCGMADSGPEPLFSYIWWSFKKKTLFDPASLSDIRGRVERQWLLKRKTFLPIDPAPWEGMCSQLDDYLDQIAESKATAIRALPHFLFWLAKRARERGLEFPHVKVVLPYGGLAGEALVKTVTETFTANFVNVYGTGEVGSLGYSDGLQHEIKLYQDMACVEILDENGHGVKPGEVGRLVVTDLNNTAMPIIRYAIGDIAVKVNPESDFVDNFLICGREQECLHTKSGRMVTTRDLQNLFFKYDEILNFKVDILSKALYKAVVVKHGELDLNVLAEELQTLLELDKKPMIKESPFIAPETSGKYLSLKGTDKLKPKS